MTLRSRRSKAPGLIWSKSWSFGASAQETLDVVQTVEIVSGSMVRRLAAIGQCHFWV